MSHTHLQIDAYKVTFTDAAHSQHAHSTQVSFHAFWVQPTACRMRCKIAVGFSMPFYKVCGEAAFHEIESKSFCFAGSVLNASTVSSMQAETQHRHDTRKLSCKGVLYQKGKQTV